MSRYALTWIDKNAQHGPLFRIGDKDIYSRERPGQRVVRLRAVHAPDLAYVEPAVEAFATLAAHWGAPIVFVIDPDVRKPPAAQFLYAWSRAAFENRSVDQSYMVMGNPFTQMLGRLVCRMFTDGGMPFEALAGERALASRLDALELGCPRPGFSVAPPTTALATRRGLGEGAYGQLLRRLLRRGSAPR